MVLGSVDLGTPHEEWTSRGDSGDTDGQPHDRDLESKQVKVSNRKKSDLRTEGVFFGGGGVGFCLLELHIFNFFKYNNLIVS